MTDKHARDIVATDDDASSTETIIERPRSQAASGEGGGNDGQDHKPDGTVPFARSSFSQNTQKPSKNRLGRKHRRLYPQKLLHIGRSTSELSVCDGEETGVVSRMQIHL